MLEVRMFTRGDSVPRCIMARQGLADLSAMLAGTRLGQSTKGERPMARKIIEASEIESSWDHSQYWQGAGLAYTEFDDIATGFGSSEKIAAEDACEQLAMQGWDTSTLDISEANDDSTRLCECGDDEDGCEHGWFVTIRVR